jgi:plastocyanin
MRVRPAAVVAWTAALIAAIALLAMPLLAVAATASVSIQNSTFIPASVTVRAGDTVTWTNRDGDQHSAKFSGMSTAVLAKGQSGSLTFSSAGTFDYICGVHGSSMRGTVVVQPVATPAPTLPPPPPTPAPAVRTVAPTIRPAAPTATPAATAEPATPEPTPTASPTPMLPHPPTPMPSPTAAAVAVNAASPVATAGAPRSDDAGPESLMLAGAAAAIAALGALAWVFARRA